MTIAAAPVGRRSRWAARWARRPPPPPVRTATATRWSSCPRSPWPAVRRHRPRPAAVAAEEAAAAAA